MWSHINKNIFNAVLGKIFASFQRLFHDTVYMLQSTGLMNKIRDDVMQARQEVKLPRYRVNQPLNLTQLAGSMGIIVIGLLVSIIVFLCELFIGMQRL